jgi:hypothetical protein
MVTSSCGPDGEKLASSSRELGTRKGDGRTVIDYCRLLETLTNGCFTAMMIPR